jgi:hypothetical protein
MKSIIMHKIVVFVINTNIDDVKEIYKDKVPDYMLSHLLDKKEEYKEYRNDNTKSWLDFIGTLDENNSDILFDFINSKR